MNARRRTLGICVLVLSWLLLQAAGSQSQPTPRPTPKLEPLAETKLLMEGLAQANFRGLEKILKQKPQEHQAWLFARGQALILAETGNLLLLRPPHNEGEQAWFQRASDFRTSAVLLANALSKKDFDNSRAALHNLAGSCNRCHQTFRVPVRIKPFEDQMKVSH